MIGQTAVSSSLTSSTRSTPGLGNVSSPAYASLPAWPRATNSRSMPTYSRCVSRVYLVGPPFADEYRRRAVALTEAAGWEPVDPMRRDFRGRTHGHETEIVEGDLADIDACDAVLAAFTAPDEGTSMEAWYARSRGIPVVVYTGGASRPSVDDPSPPPCTRCSRRQWRPSGAKQLGRVPGD